MIYREPDRKLTYKKVDGLNLPMNIYEPCSGAEADKVILVIHGGGWNTAISDNSDWNEGALKFQAAQFAESGNIAAAISYRSLKIKNTDILNLIEDVSDAVRFLKNIDICKNKKLIVMGESAGGHLAAMLGISDDDDIRPDVVIAVNPVLDCTKKFSYSSDKTENQVAASPVYRNINKASDFYFLHGTADETVPLFDTVIMHERLILSGFESRLDIIENEPHAFIVYGYKNSDKHIDELMQPIYEYVSKI